MADNLDNMPQTSKEIGQAFAEARRIFGNLKAAHSRGVLLCLSSELRKWEWSESELFTREDDKLRACLVCGQLRSDGQRYLKEEVVSAAKTWANTPSDYIAKTYGKDFDKADFRLRECIDALVQKEDDDQLEAR